MDEAELLKVAEDAAQGHLEGGDAFDGGEVAASCPRCDVELFLQTEGHTEVQRTAVVTKVVSVR